jgi:VCBS repeat-containing protein
MTSRTGRWFDFALQQMAAEAYLDQALSGRRSLIEVLTNGNNNADVVSQDGFEGATRFVSIPGETVISGTAEAFEQKYSVVDHHANDASGFSATLFKDKDNSYTLSFRSTEYRSQSEGGDFERDRSPTAIPTPGLGANGEIFSHGFALGQLLAMQKYYQSLLAAGTIPPDAKINVTGYSLGGHLATVFTEMNLTNVEQAYTFNSPGRGGFADVERLEGLEALQMGKMLARLDAILFDPAAADPLQYTTSLEDFTASDLHAAALEAWVADPDWEPFQSGATENIYLDPRYEWAKFAAVADFGPENRLFEAEARTDGAFSKITQIVGNAARRDSEYVANSQDHPMPQEVLIEDQPDATGFFGVFNLPGDFGTTHSITLIVDSLALQELFHEVHPNSDSELEQAEIESILIASSDEIASGALFDFDGVAEGNTLENALDALYTLFTGNTDRLPYRREGGGFGDIQNRSAFYERIEEVRSALDTSTRTVVSVAGKTKSELEDASIDPDPTNLSAIAYRYALKELNPFVILGADYRAHNENGELDLYDAATGKGGMTTQYVIDRAAMLANVNEARASDRLDPNGLMTADTGGIAYLARNGNGVVEVTPSGGTIFLTPRLVQFGGEGGQKLFGRELNDHLYGEGGDDTLFGGLGDDHLEGGKGWDIYEFNRGDGNDTIQDTDGLGLLRYFDDTGTVSSTAIIDASVRVNDTQWRSANGEFIYSTTPNDTDGTDLVVTFSSDASSSITLKNFEDGDFHIYLSGLDEAAPAAFRIQGNTVDNRFVRYASGPEFPDGTVNIQGGVVSYYVPLGADLTLEGLDGADLMDGGSGNDRIFGGSENDFTQLDQLTPTGQRGDYLNGYDGTDLLVGAGGDDLIVGGLGTDVAFGGPGADYINDNFVVFSVSADWRVERTSDPFAPDILNISGVLESESGSGLNVFSGGAGDDWLFGGKDNDVLFGDDGDDIIGGGDGDDTILGGAGADLIQADAPFQDLPAGILQTGDDFVDGEGGDDRIYGLRGNDTLLGGAGNDHLYGDQAYAGVGTPPTEAHGGDTLRGGAGNDFLYGDGGDDTLEGGKDVDTLIGGAGDDTYLFRAGDGADTISDESGDDTLRFGSGITLASVSLAGNAIGQFQNLFMTIGGAGDSITVAGGSAIDRFEFGDGTSMSLQELVQASGGVKLSGSDADDTLNSLGLFSVLDGGAGNDELLGSTASTTYRFDLGDGMDFIRDAGGLDGIAFGQGIGSDDISWRYDASLPGGRFTLDVGSGGDEIVIADGEQGAIERFRFADGSELSFDALLSRQGGLPTTPEQVGLIFDGGSEDYVSYLAGTAGPDFIFDFDVGHVTYETGRGNDYLEIYQGEGYRYVFNIGDGQDVINTDDAAIETMVFGPGVTPESVRFALTTQSYRRFNEYGADQFPLETDEGLHISYGDHGDSVFIVYGSFAYSHLYEIERFEFADGRTFSQSGLISLNQPGPLTAVGQANGVTLTEGDDVYRVYTDSVGTLVGRQGEDVSALGGNDRVTGGGGADIFDGGGGNDILQGGAGEDELYADASYSDYANDLLDGGDGFDYLDASLGNDLLIGGAGDDVSYSDVGNDVFLFNRGDGRDEIIAYYSETVAPELRADTLSLGGGIGYADLALSRRSDHLFLDTGQGEFINLYDWYYDAAEERTLSKLQLILDEHGDYDPSAADPLRNQRVQVFDFAEIVRQFDEAWAQSPSIGRWAVAGSLASSYLGGANDAAYGGDLAYVYATNGGYGALSNERVMATLSDAAFGGLQAFSAQMLAEIASPAPASLSFALGSGTQVIANPAVPSTLVVEAGIGITDFNVERDGVDLLITHSNLTDELRVQDWYAIGNGQFLELQFDDGSVISSTALTLAGLTVNGPDGGGTLVGLWSQPNTLSGGTGNDVVTGGIADDRISGGAGNDMLSGGAGSDTYLYNVGDGVDTIIDIATPDAPNSIEFGSGITPDMITLGQGSLLLRIGHGGDAIHLEGFDPSDAGGARAVENFRFADGTRLAYDELLARGFDLTGTAGDDFIRGTNLSDRIDGLGGNDVLEGGAGSDTYAFGAGSGQDVIREATALGDIDTLQVLANPNDVTVVREDSDIVVSLDGTSDRVAIDWFTDPGARIEQVSFANGTIWDGATLEARSQVQVNRPPVVSNAIIDQDVDEDSEFIFTVPAATFDDVDLGDALTYSATHANGNPLPAWLGFDAGTREFSGTPINDDVGTLNVRVTATDGSGESIHDDFALEVLNTNDAPVVATAIIDQTVNEDSEFIFTVPATTFDDVDLGDALTYSATHANGNPLPAWLGFDAGTREFSGTPSNDDVGILNVRVTATDGSGESIHDDFALEVLNTNDAPVVATAIIDQNVDEDSVFIFTVPATTFDDPDTGDTLTYTATLDDGNPLPVWLGFDAGAREFSGTPANDEVGTLSVRVTATDGSGESVSDEFALEVLNTNDAPIVATAIIDQTVDEDSEFIFTVRAATFEDVDIGDTLTYSALLEDGGELPEWLSFDTVTRRFTGTPGNADVGIVDVRVGATDTGGESASDSFRLTVRNVNDAPVASDDAITVPADGAPALVPIATLLMNDSDIDAGDSLSLTATTTSLAGVLVSIDAVGANVVYDAGELFRTLGQGQSAVDAFGYTVEDLSGEASTATVSVTVNGVNDAPVVTHAIADQTALEDNVFSFQLLPDVFRDIDTGDVLNYSAHLSDGSALPVWLDFDAVTRTFSGMPAYADAGAITIRLTAADGLGLSVADDFDLEVVLYPDLVLAGGPGDDVLIGHSGNDVLDGGPGNDTMIGAHGNDTYFVDSSGDIVIEAANAGIDEVITASSYTLGENLENLTLVGDGKKVDATGNASDNVLMGNDKNNALTGLAGDDWLDGGGGDDKMAGGEGDDTYLVDKKKDKVIENAGEGIDSVRSSIDWDLSDEVEHLTLVGTDKIDGKGNALDNLLVGNSAKNKLDGEAGNDIMQGLAGDDDLKNKSGTALMDGGVGKDKLDGSRDNELYIGGAGNDEIKPDKGADIVAFNRGDGRDKVRHAHGGGNTLSLGGGIGYDDLSLTRDRDDLIFQTGDGEQIKFVDWYHGDHKSAINLQVIAEAMAEFDAGSSDPLLNRKVQTFDFAAITAAFDAAGQVDNWSLTNALLDAHLSASDTEALGGDLAYQYGLTSSLSGIDVGAAQQVLNAPQFGSEAQSLNPYEELQQGTTRLV